MISGSALKHQSLNALHRISKGQRRKSRRRRYRESSRCGGASAQIVVWFLKATASANGFAIGAVGLKAAPASTPGSKGSQHDPSKSLHPFNTPATALVANDVLHT
tara:strand:- start:167 stop:481 length:315 start_codon:yes stop_codon:yes gene_type:complete